MITLIGGHGSSPGGIGDRILDDRGLITVVGVDDRITVNGEEGHKSLTEILGSLRTGLIVHVDQIGVDAHIAVAAVVYQISGDGIADQYYYNNICFFCVILLQKCRKQQV